MQTLAVAHEIGEGATRENPPDAAVVDAVLSASRSLIAVATRSLGAAAEETTIAQYRALVVLASRGPQRMAALAEALDVAPSTAGRMCNRLAGKGLIRRHRARADRRAVLVSVTAAGRPEDAQRAIAEALRAFSDAAGEVPDSQWPPPGPAEEAARPPVPARSVRADEKARP